MRSTSTAQAMSGLNGLVEVELGEVKESTAVSSQENTSSAMTKMKELNDAFIYDAFNFLSIKPSSQQIDHVTQVLKEAENTPLTPETSKKPYIRAYVQLKYKVITYQLYVCRIAQQSLSQLLALQKYSLKPEFSNWISLHIAACYITQVTQNQSPENNKIFLLAAVKNCDLILFDDTASSQLLAYARVLKAQILLLEQNIDAALQYFREAISTLGKTINTDLHVWIYMQYAEALAKSTQNISSRDIYQQIITHYWAVNDQTPMNPLAAYFYISYGDYLAKTDVTQSHEQYAEGLTILRNIQSPLKYDEDLLRTVTQKSQLALSKATRTVGYCESMGLWFKRQFSSLSPIDDNRRETSCWEKVTSCCSLYQRVQH